MRNTWVSSKTSWIAAFSVIALSRSYPNGFSKTIFAPSTSPASPMRATMSG